MLPFNERMQTHRGKNVRYLPWGKYLYSHNFPKHWGLGGEVQPLEKGNKITYNLLNFAIYVNEVDHFISNLPKLKGSKDELAHALYLATYLCGISNLNLEEGGTPNIISSIARYHVYYIMRKYLRDTSPYEKELTKAKIITSNHYKVKKYEYTWTRGLHPV